MHFLLTYLLLVGYYIKRDRHERTAKRVYSQQSVAHSDECIHSTYIVLCFNEMECERVCETKEINLHTSNLIFSHHHVYVVKWKEKKKVSLQFAIVNS